MILRELRAGDAGWILEQHGVHYAQVDGFDRSFEVLVARLLAEFIESHDPSCEGGWIAEAQDGTRLGCVFLARLDETTAKLRMFYVIPEARGSGVAQALLDGLFSFARDAAYESVRLWTHKSHRAAGRLYARNGFALLNSRPVQSFGRDLVEQSWEKRLLPV
ncbi:MAG: GNAT family N-acetyltransferase [Rhodobacteraceae bacterium]|nr:GNAT family N-acetyltransferase [Paracoccaceae bacterium]